MMDVKEYFRLTNNTNEGWDLIAMHPNKHLYLMKDVNNICYITTCDYTHTMPYWMVVAEYRLGCFVCDNPMRNEVPRIEQMAHKNPNRITTIMLNDEDMEWVNSSDIERMVECIESDI
jgi:hypothetical protein